MKINCHEKNSDEKEKNYGNPQQFNDEKNCHDKQICDGKKGLVTKIS